MRLDLPLKLSEELSSALMDLRNHMVQANVTMEEITKIVETELKTIHVLNTGEYLKAFGERLEWALEPMKEREDELSIPLKGSNGRATET
jgi:hypothetical protein